MGSLQNDQTLFYDSWQNFVDHIDNVESDKPVENRTYNIYNNITYNEYNNPSDECQ
jgi:hypothetical protein